ncbi:MAG: hypothetical protein K6F24_00400 [Atopobiaceae bacterium]|nr:hypothetical protein [Atopobiaceae bacterium]
MVLPEIHQVWLGLPYLLQVWHILTKLAESLAARTQLGAFPAALQSTTKFRQLRQLRQHYKVSAALTALALPAALQSSTNTTLVQAVLIEAKIVRQG